jgi:A/G-specific adenine glycosylase
MLQQTQVARVMEKYPLFLRRFLTVRSLAKAPLSAVLKEWSGLGYNRRAKFLKQVAEKIVTQHDGRVPNSFDALIALPGVGESTAGGILAFAYDTPVVFIETNIRRVFLHHFFHNKRNVPDSKIFPLVEKTLARKNPREWYYALFDYGTHLAATIPNPNVRSRHYAKQSKFEGSFREARGLILKSLSRSPHSLPELVQSNGLDIKICRQALTALIKEGFIMKKKNIFMLR